MTDYAALLPFVETNRQKEIVEALIETGSLRKAAAKLGIHERNVIYAVKRIRNTSIRKDASQHMGRVVQDGFQLRGVSNLVDRNGETILQWVKTTRDHERQKELMQLFIDEILGTIPARKTVKTPRKTAEDLMAGYPLGDHHYGMFSHAAETGNDYDIKIAKQLLEEAVDYLVSQSPPAKEAVFANLGDLLHIDNRQNKTPASGHILDVDTRYSKVIRVASFGIAHAIQRLLEKHERVRVVNVPGNHDQDSASWVSLVLQAWFRNEPRVTVDISPAQFLFHEFGLNMICMTHGHTVKLEEIPATMAAYQPEMWGRCKYRVAWTGHVHHAQKLALKEFRGAKVESFGVLPPNDAYSASKGFLSQREMHAITFRKSGGEMGRTTFNADLSVP